MRRTESSKPRSTRKLRGLASAAIVATLVSVGCGRSFQDFYYPHVDQACRSGHGDDCWFLGEMWMGKASWSYYPSWNLPVDKTKAREAYLAGCDAGSLRACAALVERHLLDDQPAKRQEILARVDSLGGKVLSDAEVAKEDEALEAACEADAQQKSEADREATRQALRQAASELNAGMQQISGRLAAEEAAKAARNSRLASRSSSPAPASHGGPAPKQPAPVPTLTPNAPSGPKCTPTLVRGCNKLACCQGGNAGGSASLTDVDCENDLCCVGLTTKCSADVDCCQRGVGHVSCAAYRGGEARCCLGKGLACGGHCEWCCNGDDSAQHHGDPTLSSCL